LALNKQQSKLQIKLQPKQKSDNGAATKKKKILIISVTACIALILLAVMLVHFGFFNMLSGMFVPRGEVKVGTIPISDGLNDVKHIPKGEVKYRLNKTVTFENGYVQGDIMLEDPKTCEFDLHFSFYLIRLSAPKTRI